MQLITNKIGTGKAGRFEDFIQKFKESQVKTASSSKKVKVAGEQEEGVSSGQLDVEPLHQEGESTTMPKAGPSAKKDESSNSSVSKSDPEKEGKDSGQSKAEGSEKLTNDPKDPSKDEKEASSKKETKVAGSTCEVCDCDPCECEGEEVKEAGSLPEALKKHQFKSKDDSKEDSNDEESDDDSKEEKKEASISTQFVKWANLDSKNKSFLVNYWRQLFGDDYVDAMVSDK